MEHRPIVIVGAGPAGTATALYLHQSHPELARDIVVLDKAIHPRHKVCAGGLIPHTLDCLRELDIPLSAPNAAVHRARVEIPQRRVHHESPDLCRVIRRNEFDHMLVRACRERGIEVRENEHVRVVHRVAGGIRIESDSHVYETPLAVGADGSGSLLRRSLFDSRFEGVGKAVMCDIPVTATNWTGFEQERYDFDFRDVPAGLRGYAWAFPCLIDGVPHVNVGAYAVEAPGSAGILRRSLDRLLQELGATAPRIESFPIRWYAPGGPLAQPNALLAGDAAGVDPLMGEGISFAFEYGRRVAAVAASAVAGDTTAPERYAASVRGSWLGRKLKRLGWGVRLFYGPSSPLWFGLAGSSRRLQSVGIRWYNGVDGMDRDGIAAVRRMWQRGELTSASTTPTEP